MLRIVSHLEYLLRVHDCVVVPQLGGFVLQTVPASYVTEEQVFYPMHKEIVFNPSLKHHDGLLPGEYMNVYGVSFQVANRMVEEDVEDIQTLLFKELKVSLGNVGTLRRGGEGQIIFQCGDCSFFSVNSYGLTPVPVQAWETLQGKEVVAPAKKRNIYYIAVNRSILRGIASVAAAIALFLMVSTPVKEVTPSSYTASFIPTEMVTNKAKLSTPATTTSAPASEKTKTTAAPAPVTAKPKVVKEEKLPAYYVVIGSVKTKKQADDFLAKVDRKTLKHANKITGKDRIRVYADKFTDKNKAEAYLAKIRQNSKYQDAWLYTRNK
ncbi:MAG: SPOR domain-containing protein [Tannerellaceae bacterium]|jgi:hypothetical protein|nr:SPOR domain-containing protein [Tannerellaceae bacterium]